MISFAYAQAASSTGSLFSSMLPVIPIFAIFYFLMIRPQQKRAKEHKQLIDDIKKGDEILTAGGILGRITNVDETYISLEISDNTIIKMQKQHVVSVLPKGSVKAID